MNYFQNGNSSSGAQQIVSADELWELTSSAMAVRVLFDAIPEQIRRLEED